MGRKPGMGQINGAKTPQEVKTSAVEIPGPLPPHPFSQFILADFLKI